MDSVNIWLTIIVATVIAIYYILKRQYSYWQRRGVPCIQPAFPYGSRPQATASLHSTFQFKEFYDNLKDRGCPFGGIYLLNRPGVVALDLSFIKQILIKDFSTFADRGIFYNERDDPLSAHLLALEGDRWRRMRTKLSPTFSSAQIKFMFPTIVEVGHRFQDTLAEMIGDGVDGAELEMKDLLARFTTDIIGTCAFGIECNSLRDPQSEFRRMGQLAFRSPRHKMLALTLMRSYSQIARFLRMKRVRDDVAEFFIGVVRETVQYRQTNGINRNDLMDLLIKLKNEETDGLTVEEIAAETYVFFMAGFETSSNTLAFCLYELALHPEIQQRGRNEIRSVLQRHDGKLTYEAMLEMQYIDQIIKGINKAYTRLRSDFSSAFSII